MINYDYLFFVWEKLGQLSNTINRYTSLPSAEASNTYISSLHNIVGKIDNKLSLKISDLEASVAQLKQEDKTSDRRLTQLEDADEVFDDKLTVMGHKLDQVPIVSTVVQEHGNTIDAMIDEDKSLRAKIRDLSDRLDFHERASKFICAAYDPTNLNEQAKEIYGALCPMEKHDEL